MPGFMERLRRSAEGGAEGPGAASRLGHTQNEPLTYLLRRAFTTNKAGPGSRADFGSQLHSFAGETLLRLNEQRQGASQPRVLAFW